jgi:tRNA(Ile)-lysidine synthase
MLLKKIRPPESGKKILAAVSGGADSMVLLQVLKVLSVAHRWKLVVAHFNHQLRGNASDADEALVHKTATAMKLPFVTERADVKKFAKESKLSVEMAARKLRHEFFVKVARQHKIRTVALAHHADDQVELFFLRLLRGAGGGGLGGMKWQSPSPVDRRISLVRPLLDFSKAELEQIARENRIRYREDATNSSPDFLRNRIRHELLPLLRRNYQPALNKTVLRLMEIVGEESGFVSEAAQSWRHRSKKSFKELPMAIQRQVLKSQLIELDIAPDFDLVESLRRAASQSIAVFANLRVSRDEKGQVKVSEHRSQEFDDSRFTVKIGKGGRVVFDDVRLNWRFSKNKVVRFVRSAAKSGMEYFDADKTGGEIVLRHWRAGDRFQPIGFKAAAKLQDLFTNQKILRERRHQLIVAESGGEIFWVEGLRISENFKLTPETKRVLVWKWQR